MSTIIYKYHLQQEERQTILMKKGSHILHVSAQKNIPCIWAEVDPDAQKEEVTIETFGTGVIIPDLGIDEYRNYLGTVHLYNGDFVFHIYQFWIGLPF